MRFAKISLPTPLSPHDQHVGLARGDLVDQFEKLPHLRVLEDGLELRLGPLHPLFQPLGFLAQLRRFLSQAPLLQRLGHQAKQFLRHVGFADEMKRPHLDRGDRIVERIVRSDDNDRQRRMFLADGLQEIEPLAVGQPEVEQKDVRILRGDHLLPLPPRERRRDHVAAPFQDCGQGRLDVPLIVDDADQRLGIRGHSLLDYHNPAREARPPFTPGIAPVTAGPRPAAAGNRAGGFRWRRAAR